jgi:hypothetical protein
MDERWKILRCAPRVQFEGVSVDLNLHILTMRAEIIPKYEFMCGAIDDAIDSTFLEDILKEIVRIENGSSTTIQKETEMWRFCLQPSGVYFDGKFDQGTGGDVTLAQFKVAVGTYLQFLNDPDRKLIDVVFPDPKADNSAVGRLPRSK